MSNWTEYLALNFPGSGARFHIDEATAVEDFGRTLGASDLAAGFVAPVTDLGLIAVSGDDAASFLHNQLTNDIEQLGTGEARLAGYCTPKGRLQATFLAWRDATGTIWLQLPRSIQAPLQKRLTMFVLRAKAKLRDATEEENVVAVLGIGGAAGEAALRAQGVDLPAAAWGKAEGERGTVIRMPDAFGAPRYLWLTSAHIAQDALAAFGGQLALGGNAAWRLSQIHAGVPQVTSATQDQFVPQMINFELLGGVNFKKGCYPGQEIVARTKYLGKIKRRAALASIENAAARAGEEVFSTADPDQPCGMVVNAAPNGLGGADALVEIKLAALQEDVRLGSSTGAPLRFLAMPYPLDAIDD